MAFFNAEFPDHTVYSAWSKQNADLREKRLQHHNDMLYAVVRDDIFRRRAELHEALMTVARTSLTPQGLSIPLWSYRVAFYSEPYKTSPHYATMESLIRRNGYRWSVGLVAPDYDPATAPCDTQDEWDAIWRWRLPESVHDIVRHTDVLNRLALLFGNGDYWVSKRMFYRTYPDGPLSVTVETVELRLHYFPHGLRDGRLDSILKTKAKYEDYEPVYIGMLRPYVWSGSVDPPGFSNASPAPAPLPASPPPLARRSNCNGVDDVSTPTTYSSMPPLISARRLSFDNGSDAGDEEDAVVVPTCYCGHPRHNEW